MTGLRRAIFFMVVFLTFFFNIERLDYSDQALVDIHTFVYVMVSILILATLFIRGLQKLPTYLTLGLWTAIYIGLKVTLFTSRPLIGGVYTYLSITEISMTAIACLLTINLTHSLSELEGYAVKTIFPKRNHRVKDLHEADEDIKNEFIRSRRHNRPLSVLFIDIGQITNKMSAEQGVKHVQHMMMHRFLLANLGKVLAKVVRRTDLILEPDEQDGYILLLPETAAGGASLMAYRIQKLSQKDLGLTVLCGVAAFPDEAINFDDLVKRARRKALSAGEVSSSTIDSAVVSDTAIARGSHK